MAISVSHVYSRTVGSSPIFSVPILVCVFVFSSDSFWTSSSLDVPAGVTQEEGHTGFLIHLPSAGACFNFSREKDSAIPFPRRP